MEKYIQVTKEDSYAKINQTKNKKQKLTNINFRLIMVNACYQKRLAPAKQRRFFQSSFNLLDIRHSPEPACISLYQSDSQAIDWHQGNFIHRF